jgi:phosphatidate cytidylyltransferase
MAFNWQTFRTRTLTAIIFAAIMLAGLLWNQWSFLILFSVIHFGCWWEYYKLTGKISNTSFHNYTKMGLMVLGYGLMLWFCNPAYNINSYGLKENFSLPVSAAGFALLLIGIFQKNIMKLKAFGMVVLGLVYISLCWGLMIDLRKDYFSAELYNSGMQLPQWHDLVMPCVIVFSIWINDTMAYIVGSLIGKTPLTKISPKKTWEGTIAGILLSIVIAGIIAWKLEFSVMNVMIVCAITSIAGTFGDILESKLKRMAGVKDSGSLMPGHGGFLDRFDSLLLATPFVWLYVQLFMK